VITTAPSTFEFCRDWLVSSQAFCEAMGASVGDDGSLSDEARDEARARIHRHELWQRADPDTVGEEAPDAPRPADDRPHCIVRRLDDTRTLVGTGTWAGSGKLALMIESLVPAEHLPNHADDNATTIAEKFKSRRAWATQTCDTIREELLATSGRGDADGTYYLNARSIVVEVEPGDPEEGEDDNYIGWIYFVEWR
jgi:hypothetical protein